MLFVTFIDLIKSILTYSSNLTKRYIDYNMYSFNKGQRYLTLNRVQQKRVYHRVTTPFKRKPLLAELRTIMIDFDHEIK